MNQDLIKIYDAATLMEAQLLFDRLTESGITCFIDNVTSPLDGLVAGDQGKPVRVSVKDAERAGKIVAAFEAETT